MVLPDVCFFTRTCAPKNPNSKSIGHTFPSGSIQRSFQLLSELLWTARKNRRSKNCETALRKKGLRAGGLRALQSKIALRSKDYASTLTQKCARVFLRVIALRTWFLSQNDLLSPLNTNQPIYFTSRIKISPVKPPIYVGSIQDRSRLIKTITVHECDWHSIFSITLSLSLK